MVPVLMIGLWVDDDPRGGLPPRAARLGDVAAESGYDLQVEHRTLCEAAPWIATPPAGIILSGSRLNLGETCEIADFPQVTALLAALPQVPVLGICFGHQFLAYAAGGRLERFGIQRRETDWPVAWSGAHPVQAGLPDPCPFGENHGQKVADPGRDYEVIATSADGIEAIAHRELPRLGVQFHPEYFPEQREPYGRRFLANWFSSLSHPYARKGT